MPELGERRDNRHVPAVYPIFPALSRQPVFENSREVEDGTIADPMESGYVATRPRFTRLRRKYSVSYKNLTGADIALLDQFEVSIVKGKAGAFYAANLLPNGSFECFTGSGATLAFDNWSIPGPSTEFSIGQSSVGADGSSALLFQSIVGGSLPPGPGNAHLAALLNAAAIPVNPGDTMLFYGLVSVALGTLAAGASISTQPYFTPVGGAQIYPPPLVVATNGFIPYSTTFTIPAGCTSLLVGIDAMLSNGNTSNVSTDGSTQIVWDSCGVAVVSSAGPYGRMPGGPPLVNPVRFTKGLTIRDAGWVGGQARYNVTFEVTEV